MYQHNFVSTQIIVQELQSCAHIKFLFTVNLALHPFNSTQSRLNIDEEENITIYFFHIYNLPIKPNEHYKHKWVKETEALEIFSEAYKR